MSWHCWCSLLSSATALMVRFPLEESVPDAERALCNPDRDMLWHTAWLSRRALTAPGASGCSSGDLLLGPLQGGWGQPVPALTTGFSSDFTRQCWMDNPKVSTQPGPGMPSTIEHQMAKTLKSPNQTRVVVLHMEFPSPEPREDMGQEASWPPSVAAGIKASHLSVCRPLWSHLTDKIQ